MEIRRYTAYIITLFGILTSCEKNEDLSYWERPVVESYLIPGEDVLVKVYYQKGLNDTTTYGERVGGLNLSISNGSVTEQLQEDSTGYYSLHKSNFIKEGLSYSLAFGFNGKQVTAETIIPSKPEQFSIASTEIAIPEMTFPPSSTTTFKSVRVSWENGIKDNYLLWFENQEDSPTAIDSRFSNFSGGHDVEINAGAVSYYDIQQMTFRFLGSYKAVLVHLNQEYVDMLNHNNTSSQNLTNPPTNVKNGFGIFTGMSTDTLSVTVVKE